MLLFIVLNICITLSNAFFELYKLSDTCNVLSPQNIPIIKQDWKATSGNIEVKFNLCNTLNEAHYGKYVAYIKDKTNNSMKYFESFKNGDSNDIIFHSSSSNCTLSIILDCNLYTQEPKLIDKGRCEYNVLLFSPSPTCRRPCTTLFNSRLIDFRELKKNYIVHSDNTTFNVSLCSENPICGPGYSSCNITDRNHIVPLSVLRSEITRFDENSYKLELHGKTFKTRSTSEKKFEVVIKCNWYQNSSDMHYKAVQKQGKRYAFEIESTLGCVKYHKCVFYDKFYKYNLMNLNKPDGYVVNVTDSRKIYLNLCGPLQLSPSNNNCTKTSSQVCELRNTQYISMGRLYEKNIGNDFISMKLFDGDSCVTNVTSKHRKEPRTVQTSYETRINLMCSRYEEQPRFVKEEECTIYIEWKTPQACPEIIEQACQVDLHSLTDTHFYNCMYMDKEQNKKFNKLKGLYNLTGHTYVDPRNKNVTYLLNVCGPVFDPDYPCKTNSMVAMKSLDEYDIRKKTKFFGQLVKSSITQDKLIIETSGGDLCDYENQPYKSTITFECNDKESEINLIGTTPCTLDFLWKTRYACPDQIHTCVFNLPYTEHLVDFTNLTENYIKLSISEEKYVFDLCGDMKSECISPNCIYVPVNNQVVTYNNKTHLEFSINRTCEKHKFNKTLLELVCDKLINNEHYYVQNIVDCTLHLKLATNRVCIEEEKIIPISVHNNVKEVPYEIKNSVKETISHEVKIKVNNNCTVINPYTGYVFNISDLRMNVSSPDCPSKSFSAEKQTVTLVYEIKNGCRNHKGHLTHLPLTVTAELRCEDKSRKNSTKHESCYEWFVFVLPEACRLLQTVDSSKLGRSTSSTNYTNVGAAIGYSILGLLVLVVMIGLIYWQIRRYKLRRAYGSILMQYEKDADD